MSPDNRKLHKVVCPACDQQFEAVALDGRVKGYCAVAKQYVDFLIETKVEKKNYRQDPEYRAKLRAATKKMWQNPEYRAKLRAATKKMWQNPEYRAKQKAALKNKGKLR